MTKRFLFCAVGLLLWAGFAAAADTFNEGLGDPPIGIERSTPLASVQGFILDVHSGNYDAAANYLNLDHLSPSQQPIEGPKLARRLRFVLDRKLAINIAGLSKEPGGDAVGRNYDLLGTIPLGQTVQPIRIERLRPENQKPLWVFSKDTVLAIDKLFDLYGPPFLELYPQPLLEHTFATLELWQWVGLLGLIALSWVLGALIQRLFLAVGRRLARFSTQTWDDRLVEAAEGPLLLLPVGLALSAGVPTLVLPPGISHALEVIARSMVMGSLAWYLLRFLELASAFIEERVAPDGNDARVRSLRTRLGVLRRLLAIAVWVVGSALFLMQFEVVRSVGVSLLASAGIAGLVIGLAAQKSISTLLAGIQLTLTQPVRIGDVVVVETQFGSVEEIRLTYVVVRLWDRRTLVVPISHFLEKPFENWTRNPGNIFGAVDLEVDLLARVDAFRTELLRILEHEGKDLWDGKTQSLAVTKAGEKTMTLRALVSAPDPGKLWDLRCLVREQLVAFWQRSRPNAAAALAAAPAVKPLPAVDNDLERPGAADPKNLP